VVTWQYKVVHEGRAFALHATEVGAMPRILVFHLVTYA
jgi:hypothetical protein